MDPFEHGAMTVPILEVRDNGGGLDLEVANLGGGLQNLRDRLDVLGGGVEVSSPPGSGASVRGWLPLTT